jgi:hypothetical protein
MINNLINQVRSFGYTMMNPVRRKMFLLRNFAPNRYTAFKEVMYALNTQLHQDLITEEQFENALLSF